MGDLVEGSKGVSTVVGVVGDGGSDGTNNGRVKSRESRPPAVYRVFDRPE